MSCGIEEYIYLYPVNTPTNTEIDNYIQFVLPSSQPSSVFTGYRIYYRIYLSGNNSNNPALESDWNRISQVNSTPALIVDLLENTLLYKELSFYKENTDERAYPSLKADSTGIKYKIEFNKAVEPNYVALIEYDTADTIQNYYQMCRWESVSQEAKMLFEYSTNLAGSDVSSSTTEPNKADALFIIVATGFSGTTIMSAATRLGVLALPLP